ncbi:MAG: ATP-binding cassette domain-containing protein [Candidatus Eisenbacteria bacterium]|nr:ATP-binding cassette domain-containing protein [Candidatus Eisenbacteria bacterium]
MTRETEHHPSRDADDRSVGRASAREAEVLVRASGLTKAYELPAETVVAVNAVDLELRRGEFVSLMGPSGSGKTTLLDLIGCLDSITSGSLSVFGRDVSTAGENQLVRLRRGRIGFVFQDFLLLPELTALENVQLPPVFARSPIGRSEAMGLLRRVGLEARASHLPRELSGGERQRVAIARALATSSSLLLADEPTGNLDSRNSEAVYDTLSRLNEEDGLTIVVATHDERLGSLTGRTVRLVDGSVVPS